MKYLWTLLFLLSAVHGEENKDSVEVVFPEKKPAWDTWEKVLNAPGSILNLPFLALNKTVEHSVYWVHEYKVVEKVRRVLISEDGTRVILPTYNSQVGAGVSVLKKDWFHSGTQFTVGGSYGLEHRHGLLFEETGWMWAPNWGSNLSLTYRYLPDEDFFQVGPNSLQKNEVDYDNREVNSRVQLVRKLFPNMDLYLDGEYLFNRVELNEKYSTTQYLGGGSGFSFQTAYPKGHPLKGSNIEAMWIGYKALGNNEEVLGQSGTDFWKSQLSWEQYFHLFYDRVFVVKLSSQWMRNFSSNGSIPFYHLSEIGESETVRGYERGRFRDRDRLVGRLEYRYPIWSPAWRALELSVFADGGQVQRNMFADFEWGDFHYGYGVGLLAYTEEGRFLTLELGVSPETIRFYFTLN